MNKFNIRRKFDDGYVGCPTVTDCDGIVNPDVIVTTDKKIVIHFDYPLNNPVDFTFTSKKGFTRAEFYKCICKGYKQIYATEDRDVGKTGNIQGILNRATSRGRYGIWGHHIEDLVIEGITKRNNKYYLSIGS